ncbi:MAG: YncE family protein [Planctomycetota bacterium]
MPTGRAHSIMMNTKKPRSPGFACAGSLAALAVLASCSGGSAGDRDNRGDFVVNSISTGRGTVYPYRIRVADAFGNPTATVINIENEDQLIDNVSGNNGVLPVATLDTTAILPDGNPGNHFLHFTFSHKLDEDSILSDLLANQSNSGLTGALNVIAYDPATETAQMLAGRGFVNGITYYNEGGNLVKTTAVEAQGDDINVLDVRAAGFPSFPGAAELVSNKSFVFIADTDNDLTSFETFPSNRLIRLVVTAAVRDTEGDLLEQEICTATTVGADPDPPQVLGFTTTPEIVPGNNQTGIDPTTTIQVRFNKPVQPGLVGQFFDPQNLTPPTGGLVVSVTAAAATFAVIYHADPFNHGDLCNYVVRPAYNLPGESTVDVTVQNTVITGLTGDLIGQSVTTQFNTSQGPGIINAPVAPEAVYVGIGGTTPGVSVIDLNGIGQGTGDIANTRFQQGLQPNIGTTGVDPALSEGRTNLDAGSGGALTLVRDTNLNTRLLSSPLVGAVVDIHIGAPLDLVFNNENINVNASRANQINPVQNQQQVGNTITQPPHPNPPRLRFPPPNPGRAIFGEEPTVTTSTPGPAGNIVTGGVPVNCANAPINQLVAGNPFSSIRGEFGLYGTRFMGTFYGPQRPPLSPPPPPPFCPFTSRQQVGHFLYVLDRDNRQVLVVNSNRFTVLDTIALTDPVSMAMSPHMNRLAVTNFSSSTVSFIDIDPTSRSFNQVVTETRVERGPTGICWQPDGEDLLVVSPEANYKTIISAQDFSVRRTVSGFLNAPLDVIATERYNTTGFLQGVYFAYILNGNGTVAVYESGPDGVNGIGFNDIISIVPNATFARARSIMYDFGSANGGVLIGHVDDSGLGQISRLSMTASPVGQQPLDQNQGGFIQPPTFRQKEWQVVQRYGGLSATTPVRSLLSGNSVADMATDDMLNWGGAPGQATQFNVPYTTTPYLHSGKHTLKVVGPVTTPALQPRLLFAALTDVGKIDVLELNSGLLVTTIDVPGVRVVSNYWRQ